MTEREIYLLKRKRKKIKLRQIAEHLNCSIAHISKYENGKSMNQKFVRQYMEFIDGY